MSTLLAISISDREATLVTAEKGTTGSIELLYVTSALLDDIASSTEASTKDAEAASVSPENDRDESAATEEQAAIEDTPTAESPQPEDNGHVNLETLIPTEIDASLAIVPGDRVLYRNITLPFNDPKKVDQIAPLQIQDGVPFEIDNFIIDNVVIGKTVDGEYEILSSFVPDTDVQWTLSLLSALGTDPKLLTTKASALASLANLCCDSLEGSFGILEMSSQRLSLALFVDEELKHLREFPGDSFQDLEKDEPLNDSFFSALKSSIAYTERAQNAQFSRLYIIGPPNVIRQCARALPIEVKTLDFSSFVTNKTSGNLRVDELSWAIGLFASEMVKSPRSKTTLFDFRKGPFAYKPAWKNFWNAIREELFPIVLGLVFAVGWFLSIIYTSSNSLHSVEARIKEMISSVISDGSVPYRQELIHLENQIQELENQLRGIGSLSSLSPLESLKELSASVGQTTNIQIDSLRIRPSGLSFRGSVPDNKTIGALSGALEKRKDRFCSVNVAPKGRGRKSRVNFSAEIKLCE